MVATSTLPRGTLTLSSVASFLLAATSIKEILIEYRIRASKFQVVFSKQLFGEGPFFSVKFLIFQNLVNNFFLI
jgi:hypothetical protein